MSDLDQLIAATSAQAQSRKQPMAAIGDQAIAEGMSTLKMDGIRRVVAGQIPPSEALKGCINE
jgi:hypothetical protein